MKNRNWIIVGIGLVLMLSMLLPACSSSSSPTTAAAPAATPASSLKPQSGGTFVMPQAINITNMGYTPTLTGALTTVLTVCHEGLVDQNMKTGEYVPALAESWQEDPAKKFITFKIRKNVKFHDGTPVNAQAIKDFLQRKMADIPGFLSEVISMDMLDDYTLRLNTTTVMINTYLYLAEFIGSPTHLAKGKDAIAFEPVGTGPFKFDKFERDVVLRFKRNDDYWGGKPYLDYFQYIFVPDSTTMLASLLAGESHLVDIDPKDVATVKAAGFNLLTMPVSYDGFVMDTVNPDSIFADKRIREAIEYAMNRETIAKELGYGYLFGMDTYVSPRLSTYTPGIGRKYDLAKAKQLLAEASHPNGIDITIIINPQCNKETIVALQGDLAKAGIRATIDQADMGRHASLRSGGWKNAMLYNMGMFGNPIEYYLHRTFSSSRKDYISARRPAGFDALLDKAIGETDASTATDVERTGENDGGRGDVHSLHVLGPD